MKNSNATDLDYILSLLTPGSRWLNKKGRAARFLTLTNSNLTGKASVNHPPQVVYVDDEGNTYNRHIDNFLEYYTFYNVDPHLESKLENLFVLDKNDSEPESPIDETNSMDEQLVEEQQLSSTTDQIKVTYSSIKSSDDDMLAMALPADVLNESTILYSQELSIPNLSIAHGSTDIASSLVLHRFTFLLNDLITISALTETFNPDDTRHTADQITVETRFGTEVIVWNTFVGVFPEYSKNGLYATVVVGTDHSYQLKESSEEISAEIDNSQPIEAENDSMENTEPDNSIPNLNNPAE